MKLTHSLFCLFVVVSSALSEDTAVNPRGARPIEHGYKAQDTCQTKEWPMCTDDDWGSKCPSGCRVQGLMDKADHDILKKIERIRSLLDEGRKLYRSTDQVSKNTYSYLRERLTSTSGNDNRYASLAEQLRQRITDIKIKIDRQLRLLDALKSQVRDQVIVMQRLEVDIDIKLRTCKGSCASYSEFTVDRDSYVTLDKQMDHLNTIRVQSVETVSSLGIMKSRPLKDVVLPSIFKSGTGKAEQKQLLFGDVGQMQLTLEAEGSTAESAATVSKFPTSGMGSTSSSTSSSTSTIKQCTKSVRKVVTHTKDGPVEKVEVTASGPGCEELGKLGLSDSEFFAAAKEGKDLSRDGMKITVTGGGEKSITSLSHGTSDLGGFGEDFFKGLGSDTQRLSSSSSSSSSSTKTVVSDGSKSFSKTTFSSDPIGDDLGAFMRGDVEEDLPDIHARSLKSKDERKAGFVGGDCVEILQKHANGGQSGLFKIKPAGSEEVVEVYCDQGTGMGGWVLVQQREDGSVNFNRTWKEYRNGFGQVDQKGKGEVWIGNIFLHLLTQKESLLRVELQDWQGNEAYAEYSVKVGSEAEGFPLTVSDYTGDAGDALVHGQPNLRSFLSHAGMKFSTFDRDNDKWEDNCAEMYGGGWWYNNCQSANLNGIYYKGGQYDPGTKIPYEIENGVVWLPFKPADYSLKVVRMKIRPVLCTALKSSRKQHNQYDYSKSGQCPARPTYPLCSDEEREDKCPSGCQLEGLINVADEGIRKRLRNICERIQQNQDITLSVMQKSVQFYGSQRKTIIQTHMQELRYVEFAEDLQRNLTFLHKRSAELAKDLQKHHRIIWDQINEIRRTEVDIDIKIRACKGSCKQTFDHAVDNEAFKAMENKMAQFSITSKRRKSFSKVKKLKLQSADRPTVSPTYRKIPIVRTELLTKFEDIEQHQVVLDEPLEYF